MLRPASMNQSWYRSDANWLESSMSQKQHQYRPGMYWACNSIGTKDFFIHFFAAKKFVNLKVHSVFQVYQCLSSPANSKMAGKMFKDLKDGVSAQTEALSCQDSNRTDSQHNNARTIESSDVMDGGGKKLQPDETESQSSGSNNTSSQSGNADVVGLCPPLNPFIVPLKLLMHR